MAKRNRTKPTLAEVCEALYQLAPLHMAESWDNVGLLAGDGEAAVGKVMFCIDLTPAVAAEAVRKKVDLVMAYHPPIFKPVGRITAQSGGPEAAVFRCIANGIAVYSTHTAFDCAEGGTNDVLAGICGIKEPEPIEWVDEPGVERCKFVTFVPAESVEAVAEAMFAAGAGRIGEYDKCSYRVDGYGTFLGSDSTSPAVGQAGVYERVDEVRLETVCSAGRVAEVSAALRAAHPYEEPAFDVYPLRVEPVRGMGLCGPLSRPVSLAQLARKLKRSVGANCVQYVGDGERVVKRAIVVVGAAGSVPFRMSLGKSDVILTGEIRHHDALTINRKGCCAIALNHWTSERPALESFAKRLCGLVPGISTLLSDRDCEPFRAV